MHEWRKERRKENVRETEREDKIKEMMEGEIATKMRRMEWKNWMEYG